MENSKLTLKRNDSLSEFEVTAEVAAGVQNHIDFMQAKIDSLNEQLEKISEDTTKNDGSYKVEGKEYTDMGAMYKDMCALSKKYKDIMGKYDSMKSEYDKMKAKKDALDIQVENIKNDTTERDIEAEVNQRVRERVDIITKAKDYVEDSFDFQGKSNLEIKQSILDVLGMDKTVYGNYNEDQVDVAISTMETYNKTRKDNFEKQTKIVENVKPHTDQDDAYQITYDKTVEAVENAWMKPLV